MPAKLRITQMNETREQRADRMTEALAHLQRMRERREEAETDYRDAEAGLMSLLSSHGLKSSTVALDESRYRVAVVVSERLSVNEQSLRKAITAPVFDKLCDLKLNRQKLELAIAEGRVDPVVVATYTTKTENRPYLRVTMIPGSQA